MPARRAKFGTQVLPQEDDTLSEGTAKWVRDDSIDRVLGGSSVATLTGTQWGEGWSSFQHPEQHWEDADSDWDDMGEAFDGILNVGGVTSLNVDSGSASNAVAFLYVANLGTESNQGLKLSLDGSNYKLYIPPLGSVNIRGDGSTLQMQHVKVNKVDADTSIEFIIAK